jgi:hypothetical protein
VPEHKPEAPDYHSQRRQKAFGKNFPAGKKFPEQENGDQYRKKFQGEKIPQRVFKETAEFLKNPADTFRFVIGHLQ